MFFMETGVQTEKLWNKIKRIKIQLNHTQKKDE